MFRRSAVSGPPILSVIHSSPVNRTVSQKHWQICVSAYACVWFYVCVVQAVEAQQLDELCFLTAQSMTSLRTSDHFQIVKLLGEGSYGKVMLAVHRKRGGWRAEVWSSGLLHCTYNKTWRRSTWLKCIHYAMPLTVTFDRTSTTNGRNGADNKTKTK